MCKCVVDNECVVGCQIEHLFGIREDITPVFEAKLGQEQGVSNLGRGSCSHHLGQMTSWVASFEVRHLLVASHCMRLVADQPAQRITAALQP